MYEDTPDQESATRAVKHDMEEPSPMDRLVCGDVGFGKTEIAIRAAFKAVADGRRKGDLVAIAIAGGPKDGSPVPCPPCGICRQVLSEFADASTFTVLWVTEITDGDMAFEKHTLSELLPGAFEL